MNLPDGVLSNTDSFFCHTLPFISADPPKPHNRKGNIGSNFTVTWNCTKQEQKGEESAPFTTQSDFISNSLKWPPLLKFLSHSGAKRYPTSAIRPEQNWMKPLYTVEMQLWSTVKQEAFVKPKQKLNGFINIECRLEWKCGHSDGMILRGCTKILPVLQWKAVECKAGEIWRSVQRGWQSPKKCWFSNMATDNCWGGQDDGGCEKRKGQGVVDVTKKRTGLCKLLKRQRQEKKSILIINFFLAMVRQT